MTKNISYNTRYLYATVIFLAVAVLAVVTVRYASAVSDSIEEIYEIKISELGLVIQVPRDLSDMTYKIDTTTFPESPTILFSSSLLEDSDKDGFCTSSYGPLGLITVTKLDPVKLKYAPSYDNWHSAGEYNLIYQYPQQGCSRDAKVSELQSKLINILHKSFVTTRIQENE